MKRIEVPYILEFEKYIIKQRHNTKSTAINTSSRLYKIHSWLINNKNFKKKHKEDWAKVLESPLAYVDIGDMSSFFERHYHKTSANSRKAYKSTWNLFMIYAEIFLGIDNPIPDRHWKIIIVGKKNGKDKTKSELIISDENIPQIIASIYLTNIKSARQKNALILRTLIETGARISEVLLLHQSSFNKNEEGKTATVTIRNKKTIQYRNPTREIPISTDLYNAIQSYFAIRRSELSVNAEALAFPTDKNKVINQSYFRKTCTEPIAEHLGLKGLHPHLFRHYRISTWCESAKTESDMAQIAYWAGDTVSTIRNVYLHIK